MIKRYRVEMDAERHPFLVKDYEKSYRRSKMDSPEKIVAMLNDCFNFWKFAEEHTYMVALDVRATMTGVFEVSHGSISATQITPRELFLRALLSGAYGIVVLHNHPSGDPSPSKEDEIVCARIDEAGKMIGVPLIDFIVVGNGCYYSFREKKLLKDDKIKFG